MKAAKNDDADIDTEFWDKQVLVLWKDDFHFRVRWTSFCSAKQHEPCFVVCSFLLRWWWRNVRRSFCRFMRQEFSIQWWLCPCSVELAREWDANITAGWDCIVRTMKASWWDWDPGSRLFFWRWPEESRKRARDGHPIFVDQHLLPAYTVRQPPEPDNVIRQQVHDKSEKFRA